MTMADTEAEAEAIMVAAATQALDLAMRLQTREAAQALADAAQRIQPQRVNWFPVLLAWADLTFMARFGMIRPAGAVALTFTDGPGGPTIPDARQVAPSTAWVGRFFAARLARDEPTLRALAETLPAEMVSACVRDALNMAALACRGYGDFTLTLEVPR
jgi:hypothetical protein